MIPAEGAASRWLWRRLGASAWLKRNYQMMAPIFGVAALACLAGAILAFSTAAPAKPVPVDGTVEAADLQDASTQYPYFNLHLAGDPTVYHVENTEYESLPDLSAAQKQPITIWIDDGTNHVLAVSLASETYRGKWMDNPNAKLEGNHVTAVALAVVALFLGWLVWWVIPHKEKSAGKPPAA